MKKTYRDCQIESKREKCLGGWSMTYYSAYTKDGYEICCDFTEGPVSDGISYCKHFVDLLMDECGGSVDKLDEWRFGKDY